MQAEIVPSLTPDDVSRKSKPETLDPVRIQRLVLTGFMGAGKSTIGRILAQQLSWEFLDLDQLVESRAGLSVPEIFARLGEPSFRKLESQALASVLGRNNLVLALGGGAPEILTNRLLIEQTPGTSVIFLDAPFSTLFDRCVLQALAASPSDPVTPQPGITRPLLADPSAAEARFLARRPIYRRVACLIVDTSSHSTEDTVAAILTAMKAQTRCK